MNINFAVIHRTHLSVDAKLPDSADNREYIEVDTNILFNLKTYVPLRTFYILSKKQLKKNKCIYFIPDLIKYNYIKMHNNISNFYEIS